MLAFDKLHILERPVRANSTLNLWSPFDANLIGGSLVGVGMALSGACPGTVLVQLVLGISSAKATASGALLGAAIHIQVQEWRRHAQPMVQKSMLCRRTISEMSGIPEVAVYSLFWIAVAVLLRYAPAGTKQSLVIPALGGLLIGCAQALSLLLTRSPLGVSAAYEHLSQYALGALRGKIGARPNLPSTSIIFSLGVMAGSLALSARKPNVSKLALDSAIPTWQAFVGGIFMTFGARLGGGCTSGHGLSGLSAMSASSLVTVTAMFGAGILTRMILE